MYASAAIAGFAAFCVVNASFSLTTLNTATAYYLVLSEENVAALNWLSANTSSNAIVYDGLGIVPWIWGYAHRLAYGPAPLGVEATSSSLLHAEQADAVWLGSSLLQNDELTVAQNAPSPVGVPSIFVDVPGYWMQIISTQANLVNFTLLHGSTQYKEDLASATLVTNSSSISGGGSVVSVDQFLWPGLDFGVSEELNLTGGSVSVTWSGINSTVQNTTSWLGLVPPSPVYGTAASQPEIASAPQIVDSYTLNGAPFSMTLSGGTLNQTIQPNGWGYVWCTGRAGWTAKFVGITPVGAATPIHIDSSALVHQLGINYFTVNPITDYQLFLRLQHQAIGVARVAPVFQDGETYIFSIVWP